TCSAPAFPSLASFSDIAVNPEMSTNAIVPSSSRHSRSSLSASHSMVSRGTYGVSAARVETEASAVPISKYCPLDFRSRDRTCWWRGATGGRGAVASMPRGLAYVRMIVVLSAVAAALAWVTPALAAGGSITGSRSDTTVLQNRVNLTTQGPIDWAVWGYGNN